MKAIVLFKIYSPRHIPAISVRVIGEDSPRAVEDAQRARAESAGGALDCVEVLDVVNLAQWSESEEGKHLFAQSLDAYLNSSALHPQNFQDLLSVVAAAAYFKGESAGHSEAVME